MKKNRLLLIGALTIASLALWSFKRGAPIRSRTPGYAQKQVRWVKQSDQKLPGGQQAQYDLAMGTTKLYAIKVRVLEGELNLLRCEIHYTNGKTTSVTLRNAVHKGEESREIMIADSSTPVARIILWYDAPGSGPRTEIWTKLTS